MTRAKSQSEERLQEAISKVMVPEEGPIADLAFALAAATVDCGRCFNFGNQRKSEEGKAKELLLICFEYMYFFLYATSCVMRNHVPTSHCEAQVGKLQTLVIKLVVEMFLHSLDKDRKCRLRDDVLQQMRGANITYQESHLRNLGRGLRSSLDSLELVLSERLAELLGEATHASSIAEVISPKVNEKWTELTITSRVSSLKDIL